MQRILVAGATGYLGGHVIREAKARGHHVRALARNPAKLEPIRDALDETMQAEVTRPRTLAGVCDGIDVVFSSVGITRQCDGLRYRDVDFQGNANLLKVARQAGVGKFIYTSVFGGQGLRHLAIVKAHEDFVDLLKRSGIDYAIIRPTGFFSDMEEYLGMARRGGPCVVGPGTNRINPIHGADLARCCIDAIGQERLEIDVGGPETYRHREIAELACDAVGRRRKVTRIPAGLLRIATRLTRFIDRQRADLLAFLTTVATRDAVAPPTGDHSLRDHFLRLGASP